MIPLNEYSISKELSTITRAESLLCPHNKYLPSTGKHQKEFTGLRKMRLILLRLFS
ncbi:hypothetical protein X975_06681, partial [Stegodyphus mimosarum]